MIYGFNVVEGMPTTTEPISDITQPLWSLSLAETRTNRGGLSRGMPTPLATQFILTTFYCVVSLVIPHKHDEEPCLSKVAELDTRAVTQTRAGGFEKAIILHRDQMVSRLGFSWGSRDAGNVDPWPPGSCICAISKDYSYLYGGMRPPKFDEGIGRIVQDTRRNILVIDMSLIYMIH
ncbi:hypothetical protein BDZ94DRAFT_1263968 [Collybia nuda]|uniref:Uncharacterized protein n=1 Tax=Collybia nuda TaxID=64659 RepID=A0A9P5Y345_9AGAR|nr:hypothetical protein BDZ94DRAFT_1263968 [Collybia nuda]